MVASRPDRGARLRGGAQTTCPRLASPFAQDGGCADRETDSTNRCPTQTPRPSEADHSIADASSQPPPAEGRTSDPYPPTLPGCEQVRQMGGDPRPVA